MSNKKLRDELCRLIHKHARLAKWTAKDYREAIDQYEEEIEYLEHGIRRCPYCDGKYKNVESHLSKSECG